MRLTRLINCFFDILAEVLNMRPGARSFKAFSDLAVFKAKVANVRNHVRQLITFDAIFSAARDSLVLTSNFKHLFHLSIHFISLTFEEARGCTHLISFETDDFQKELFLDLIDDVL